MSIKIALAGNPNSGKTTLFNELTGSSQYVGNWPGVTVEKKEGKLKKYNDVIIVDLPGIYSLSPYTLEEVVSRNFIIEERPDAIINIVDSTNIERNLYLTTQFLEMGIPVVIALNMIDVLQKKGDKIDIKELSKNLGCPVVEISALKGIGVSEVADIAVKIANEKLYPSNVIKFDDKVENEIKKIEEKLGNKVTEHNKRWYGIKILENDSNAFNNMNLSNELQILALESRNKLESDFDDDIESIITFNRYEFVSNVIKNCVLKSKIDRDTTSDKIDKFVTNRILGLPFFAFVMYIVYYLSIATIGTAGTDWVNDVLFGEIVPGKVDVILSALNVSDVVASLVQDGIVAGVGAVLGFLPQMAVLFLLLAILEDTGYMARVAFIMDRIFRKFGLSGKSFIPMLIGTGCSVPGIMASRTIENERDRKITVMTTSFIPCSAKLPVIALIAGALFNDATWVASATYFIGIAVVIISGIILKKTEHFSGEPAPFVMELPPYHFPKIKGVLIQTWDRLLAFVKKASTIIFVASALIWFLQSFDFSLQLVDDANNSMLAILGSSIAPIFAPLGWGDWRATVAAVSGLVAKENVVGTFGVLYGFEEVAENGEEIWGTLSTSFTQLSAMSFLIFNMICAPCFAAIGAIKRELQTAKATILAVAFQTILAYVLAFIYYQIGLLYTTSALNLLTVIAFVFAVVILFLLFRPEKKRKN